MVKSFNDPMCDQFVFLLSSKAGGCGLNLIGGNRLILFDMSWNPADDKQAAARVWRDGQQKRVYVYKLMTTGTIEEKIFQRQINKEGLQSVVDGGDDNSAQAEENLMSKDQLKDLFTYDPSTLSTTFEHMVLDKLPDEVDNALSKSGPVLQQQSGCPKEDDLANWGLHSNSDTVPDECMQLCGHKDVSFVFSCQVEGKPIPPDRPILSERKHATDAEGNYAEGNTVPARAMEHKLTMQVECQRKATQNTVVSESDCTDSDFSGEN